MRSLLRAGATVSGLTFLSRITGLIRDTLIARLFGASALTDAFWVAFRIPNLLRRLFAEGAFSQAFVPILGQVSASEDAQHSHRLLDHVASILALSLLLISIVGVVLSPVLVWLMGSGLSNSPDAQHAAVTMTRIMFPYIFCMSLVAFASGVLNVWRHFLIPAFTPVLLNIAMVLSSWLLTPYLPASIPAIYALAIGVMVGGVLQLGLQILALRKLGYIPRIHFNLTEAWNDPIVRKILRQMLPAILGVSVAQLSLIINTNIATWLTPGSVSWLSFADRLMEFPTALLGVALGTVLLPSLAKAHAQEDVLTYSALLDWALRLTLLLGLPAALSLVLLGKAMVAALFHYGAFTAHDVSMTQFAVNAYSVGLLGFLSIKILAPGFYAKQNIRTPVKIAVVVLIMTQLLNLIFVPLMGHVGLALAIGLGACVNALALLIGLIRRGSYKPLPGWLGFVMHVLIASALMCALLVLANHYLDWIVLGNTPWLRVLYLAILITAAAFVYFFSLFLFGYRPSQFRRMMN